MSLVIFFTKFISFLSVGGSIFIILSYLKFSAFQDFTFLIVVHMAIANAIMNFSMLVLHGSIVVPLCSTTTLVFYSSATSYILFVSIISYLLYRKLVLRKLLPKDEMKRQLVISGWILPIMWLAIPSAFPEFWTFEDGKIKDGCKHLTEFAVMDTSDASLNSTLYTRAVLRISIFLFVPS